METKEDELGKKTTKTKDPVHNPEVAVEATGNETPTRIVPLKHMHCTHEAKGERRREHAGVHCGPPE